MRRLLSLIFLVCLLSACTMYVWVKPENGDAVGIEIRPVSTLPITLTYTPSATSSHTPTNTPTVTRTSTLTVTNTTTATSTRTMTPTATNTRTMTPTPSPSVTPIVIRFATVITGFANLRNCASTTTCIRLATIVAGTRLQILTEQRGSDGFMWYNVRYVPEGQSPSVPDTGTIVGWMRSDVLRIELPVTATPVPTNIVVIEPSPTAEILLSNITIPLEGKQGYLSPSYGASTRDSNGNLLIIYPSDISRLRLMGVQVIEGGSSQFYEYWAWVCILAADNSGSCISQFWINVD